jgi:SAM-dependent methyltransferase
MLIPRPCPICNTPADQASLFIAKSIDLERLSDFSFASRKVPEYMCHQLVRCQVCDLVYANEPPSAEDLAQAYHTASYDSTEEANDAANSYALAIKPILPYLTHRDIALEIGTGTGIFLEYLKSFGFTELIGVEPSSAAIEAAPAARRILIRECMFEEHDFQPESIDLICCFMTMEHVPDPLELSRAAFRLLRPGGAFVTVTHDYRSSVNRLLGKRSPIIDIEHLQIFSQKSIRELFVRTGFDNISVKSFVNHYSLHYWLRLSPLPGGLKRVLGRIIASPMLKGCHVGLNVGNSITAGFRRN